MSEPKIGLNQMVGEAVYELAMRDQVYPGLVARGKLRQSEADWHRGNMAAILRPLEWLRENEHKIRDDVRASCPAKLPARAEGSAGSFLA